MLTDFREILRELSSAANLDEMLMLLVRRVTGSLPVDVCAFYLAGSEAGHYILMASDGLSSVPAGQIRSGLQAGLLSLVSERQELVVLPNATAHPRYCPLPETGEEPFHTFLGIPLIHGQHDLGVLVAWKKQHGQSTTDEAAFFVTIAAQVSKLVYEAEKLGDITRLLQGDPGEKAFIQGVQAAPGMAFGTAVLIDPLEKLGSVPDRQAEDIDAEVTAFKAAAAALQEDLRTSSEQLADAVPSEVREFVESASLWHTLRFF